jgi:hypothetical protein
LNGRCVILAGLVAAVPGLACAPVPGAGQFVRVAAEEAIIIWDQGARREHFIRRASFDTNAKHFGFLVPTPSKPEIGESDDDAFDFLARLTAQAVVRHEITGDGPRAAATVAPDAVTVLEEKRVAGLDAVVLEADEAGALDAWLKQHGYPSSPALVEWYAPYVAAKWKITAFKMAAGSPRVFSAAVRMSFQTEKPFFPYREPATQRAVGEEPRLLRVYFIGEGRFAGALGESGPWPGKAVWSKPLEVEELGELLKVARLPSMAGGGARWLTQFEDRAAPRPGIDEVFFRRAASDTPLERAPLVVYGSASDRYFVAGMLVVLIMGGVGFWARRRSRRRHG